MHNSWMLISLQSTVTECIPLLQSYSQISWIKIVHMKYRNTSYFYTLANRNPKKQQCNRETSHGTRYNSARRHFTILYVMGQHYQFASYTYLRQLNFVHSGAGARMVHLYCIYLSCMKEWHCLVQKKYMVYICFTRPLSPSFVILKL